MTYYKMVTILNRQTNEHDAEKEKEYTARYCANFEALLGSVYWHVITPLLELRRGRLTKVLEITGYRVPGQFTVDGDCVSVATERHAYLFEKTDTNPLDEVLKE